MKNGLRLQPEMQSLHAAFRHAGFDVWVCSASFVDVIKEISSNPAFGYDNPPERVLAMALGRDDNTGERVMSQLHTPLGATQGKALKWSGTPADSFCCANQAYGGPHEHPPADSRRPQASWNDRV